MPPGLFPYEKENPHTTKSIIFSSNLTTATACLQGLWLAAASGSPATESNLQALTAVQEGIAQLPLGLPVTGEPQLYSLLSFSVSR